MPDISGTFPRFAALKFQIQLGKRAENNKKKSIETRQDNYSV